MKRLLFLAVAHVITATAFAQQPDFREDIPLEVYLDALTQISPAAREAADAYLQAFQRRCNRSLTTRELRRAVADGDGDPVLMGMIRAVYQKDGNALRTLASSVSCARRG